MGVAFRSQAASRRSFHAARDRSVKPREFLQTAIEFTVVLARELPLRQHRIDTELGSFASVWIGLRFLFPLTGSQMPQIDVAIDSKIAKLGAAR